ncbi:hypothetical protein ACFU6M_01530 [Streptomyces bottropensis]|uniref:hypothetical protein n=1 Tax=Streptomyces bottropensis TaxID=42235 RepID=UPI0036C53549
MNPLLPYDDKPHHTTPVTFQWTRSELNGKEVYVATGTCPECGCTMTRRFTAAQYAQAKGGGFWNRRKDPGSQPFSTLCRCTSLHTDRPDGVEIGCGARITIASWTDGT